MCAGDKHAEVVDSHDAEAPPPQGMLKKDGKRVTDEEVEPDSTHENLEVTPVRSRKNVVSLDPSLSSEPEEEVGRMQIARTMTVDSHRSLMGGVQRRIKLIEELQGSPDATPKSWMTPDGSIVSASNVKRRAMSMPCLIMSLVSFAVLSTGGGMLVALEVQVEGPLTREDVQGLKAVCIGIFCAGAAASLLLGLLLGCLVSRPLRSAVSSMVALERRTSDGQQESKELLRRKSWISDVVDIEAATSHLLESIDVFKRYLPETVVQDIVRGDGRARRLHVERRTVTIMFSDLQDFTTISEKLTHQNLLFLLTRYLSTMTRIVDSYEGVIAEILGDGLLVFWNTPDDVAQHGAKACAAALAQCEALEALNEEFSGMGLPTLFIRVGIHTGTVLTGNIGSERKMKFGCMGDPVNLASRLEGLCKNYGVNVICTAETHADLPEDNCFCTRMLDLVQVKGKNEPTRIYEVMGLDTGDDAPTHHYSEGASSTSSPEKEKGRHMKSFCAVAKEAVTESNVALAKDEVVAANPFIRLLRKTKKRLSITSEETASVGARRPERKRTNDSSNDAEQLTFSEFARGVSNNSRGPLRSRRASAQTRAYAASYEKALLFYQSAEFAQARELAEDLLVDAPKDRAAKYLLERASRYLGPSGEIVGLSEAELKAWTGVNVMTEK